MKCLFSAAALAVVAVGPAWGIEVSKTATFSAPPEKVWQAIGDFCGISQWVPVIASCQLSDKDGVKVRTLGLKGGGTVIEKQTARDDSAMSYSYAIIDSPLPVSDYQSTISVMKDGSGSKVSWKGTFNAKGAPDAKAQELISGIYDAGLKGLADKAK